MSLVAVEDSGCQSRLKGFLTAWWGCACAWTMGTGLSCSMRSSDRFALWTSLKRESCRRILILEESRRSRSVCPFRSTAVYVVMVHLVTLQQYHRLRHWPLFLYAEWLQVRSALPFLRVRGTWRDALLSGSDRFRRKINNGTWI